jgi:hypothetical protein
MTQIKALRTPGFEVAGAKIATCNTVARIAESEKRPPCSTAKIHNSTVGRKQSAEEPTDAQSAIALKPENVVLRVHRSVIQRPVDCTFICIGLYALQRGFARLVA